MTTVATPQQPEQDSQPDVKRQVARLCRDYELWARHCYRVRNKAGQLVPLQLFPVQRRIGAIEREELTTKGRARIYVLKGRQAGITTDQQARSLHLCWKRPGTGAMTLASTREETDKIFRVTSRAIEHFPLPLLPRLGLREVREISFPGLDSSFVTGTAGAKRTGRAITLQRLHGSEFAFWDEPRTTLSTVDPAIAPHGSVVVLETTASGYGSEAHKFWQEAIKGENSYRTVFFPWWECDPINYRLALEAPDELGALEPDEQDLVEHKGLDLEQIKWRREKMRDYGTAKFLQEYAEDPESCWIAAGGTFYDAAVLKTLMTRALKPRETLLNGRLELYRAQPEGERVIIGCDTAEGGGGDRSTWTARAYPSWRLLAQFADKGMEPDPLADMLDEWGRKLGSSAGPAFLVIEKNGHGITTLRRLRDIKKYPKSHLYHRARLDSPEAVPDKQDRIGWHTSVESYPLMLDAGRQLFHAATQQLADVPTVACLHDAFAVRRDATGKISLSGKDVLVSEILAWLGRDQIPRPWVVR